MKCFSYCSAGDYNLAELCQYLEQYFGTINYQFIGDILHCDYDGKHIFFFPYGCSVLWGTDENTNIAILKLLDHVSVDKLDKIICDIVTYKYDDGHLRDRLVIDEENDLITLESDDILLKFSVSYGLSQSVKLKEFEFSVSNTIDATGDVTEELYKTGDVSMSKKELSKKVGQLFAEKNYINLHSHILDTPEFFWHRSKYEPIYLNTFKYLDISTRMGILNNKLDVIQDLYNMLLTKLDHQNTNRLEWIIIILIAIEVLLSLGKEIIIPWLFGH